MHEVLVNPLGGLSLPRKSVVRLTDRPDMTSDVYRGRKTTIQQQQLDHWDCLWNEFSLADDIPTERETSSVELLIRNDYYLEIILPQKVEVQSGLYMLGSKLGWILSGRTSEIVENSTESSMLIMTHGKRIDNETTFLTCLDKSLPI